MRFDVEKTVTELLHLHKWRTFGEDPFEERFFSRENFQLFSEYAVIIRTYRPITGYNSSEKDSLRTLLELLVIFRYWGRRPQWRKIIKRFLKGVQAIVRVAFGYVSSRKVLSLSGFVFQPARSCVSSPHSSPSTIIPLSGENVK